MPKRIVKFYVADNILIGMDASKFCKAIKRESDEDRLSYYKIDLKIKPCGALRG